MKRLLLSLGAGILATVLFFIIGGLFSGGGHSLVAINVFFPYSGIVGPSLKDTRWEPISMILLLAQFPAYTLLVAYSTDWRPLVATVLLLIHMVAAVAALHIYHVSQPTYALFLAAAPPNKSLDRSGGSVFRIKRGAAKVE